MQNSVSLQYRSAILTTFVRHCFMMKWGHYNKHEKVEIIWRYKVSGPTTATTNFFLYGGERKYSHSTGSNRTESLVWTASIIIYCFENTYFFTISDNTTKKQVMTKASTPSWEPLSYTWHMILHRYVPHSNQFSGWRKVPSGYFGY